jgi:hypothetical protein
MEPVEVSFVRNLTVTGNDRVVILQKSVVKVFILKRRSFFETVEPMYFEMVRH